jgi:dephospho-CoA kinase
MIEAQARARIAAQMPLAEKAKVADFVIDNSGDLEHTHQQADAVLDAILDQLQIERGRFALG